jgi:hypothetical protein
MFIYKAEQAIDGLADRIKANCSVAYTTELSPWAEADRQRIYEAVASIDPGSITEGLRRSHASLLTKASITDIDLYFTKSIFVTTNWNKNDDVFSRYPTWAARATPTHKRTNLEHDEKQLVGHITDTWALDMEGNVIPDDIAIDDLPNMYHLANGAVIYMKWEDDDLSSRANDLVEMIEAGEKYVSMEALFSDFDYAVVTPENQYHVVGRQEDTAFLTKHLRAYGGEGTFDGCKLGRLLKNITFAGKGYVDKPANPHSVIFNDVSELDFSSASTKNPFEKQSGVFISCSSTQSQSDEKTGETLMSDTLSVDLLQKQNEELKATVANLQEEVKHSSKASIDEKVKAFEATISDFESKVEAAKKESDEAKAEVATLTEAKEGVEKELAEANKAKAELETQVSEAKAAQTKANRVSRLVEAGYDKEAAEAKVEPFASLNDEQFEVVACELVEAKKHMEKDDKEEDKSKGSEDASSEEDQTADSTGEANANDETLENAEANSEPNMSASASSEDEGESLRDELRVALGHILGSSDDDEQGEGE